MPKPKSMIRQNSLLDEALKLSKEGPIVLLAIALGLAKLDSIVKFMN